MTFKILDKYNLINGVSDSSNGPINPFSQVDAEQRVVKFLKSNPRIHELTRITRITKKDLIFADQIHKDGIHICQKGDSGSIRLGVDALITNHKGQILVVKTADCLPILVYDPIQKVVAAIHGGRRSLTMEIISKTISKMKENFGTNPKNLKVAIGPHIRKCHYWLRPKALKELEKTKWRKYFDVRDNGRLLSRKSRSTIPSLLRRTPPSARSAPLRSPWFPLMRDEGIASLSQETRYKIYFDITKAALDELSASGVLKRNIEDCGICTFCQYQKYYSARKKEENPEIYKEKLPCFGSIIGLVNSKCKMQISK